MVNPLFVCHAQNNQQNIFVLQEEKENNMILYFILYIHSIHSIHFIHSIHNNHSVYLSSRLLALAISEWDFLLLEMQIANLKCLNKKYKKNKNKKKLFLNKLWWWYVYNTN